MKLSRLIFVLFILVVEINARPFTILSTISPPFKYLDKNGQPSGIHIDIWKKIFKELNIEYDFDIGHMGSKRVKHEIEEGRAELHFNLSKRPERLEKYIFPEESYVIQTWNFFIRAEYKEKIKYEALEDLKGWIIGATRSYTYTKEFWGAGLDLEISSVNKLQIEKLLNNRIDVVILKTTRTLYQLQQRGILDKVYVLPKPLISKRYYNAFSRSSTQKDKGRVIRNFDRIIRRMKKNGTIKAIYERYFEQAPPWLSLDVRAP
ncbi:MAG: amino acid ABC transporter substrate-binding protein [Desulfobacterales bacterium]|nr:amino acid ABC transporter substrate-binding protein [Desulfobacterales bacterium]MCP4161796.1 amino acid ABC transporter substrate-binding protein [Deltaproteobacteria bacterium]